MEEDPGDYAWFEADATMEEDPVSVSLGPMGHLFQQLRSAIASQYRKLKLNGIKAKIQILGQGLEGLCTDLKAMSESEDTVTRCWVSQVRDLCYDTSDYLDKLMHYSGRQTKRRFLRSKKFSVSRGPTWNQLRLSFPKEKKLGKLSALVARVEDAEQRRKRFNISPPQASSKYYDPQAAGVSDVVPQFHLPIDVDNIIKLLGFEHDHGERNLMGATIFGSAGVGKTAVARTLYHQYRGRFQCRAFLRVSRDPDTRRLLADMLSQIKAPAAHAFSDVGLLIATITKHLQGKSYLVVIDDLWDTSTWDIISRALPDGDRCRIITTTEVEDVALSCCSDQLKQLYEITPLNDDQSGISEGGCNTYPSNEGMKEDLNLVYNNLPPYLKTCLLYLNIYPEGWTVRKDELVKQWVAEGFIPSLQGQDVEETAGCYFDALVSTGMVQPIDTNHNDEVLSCTLHHLVLDIIRQKSMEENFVTIVNYFRTILGLPEKVRRLSVQLGGAKGANNITENLRISQVRSLLFCGLFKSVPSILEYGLLQVLILHIWSDQDGIFDLTTVSQLYRLRYLKIDCSITVKLPRKIRNLQQLNTLQVDARLYVVPSDIVHLKKLLHLRLPSESILPHGFRRMTCLRTLGSFDLGCNSEDNVRDLGELENLKDLQLTCSPVQSAESLEKNVQLLLGSVLQKLGVLQSVTLVPAAGSCNVYNPQDGADALSMIISCDGSSSVFPARTHLRRLEVSRRCLIFSRLPKWLGELAQLYILKIAVMELSKKDIDILNVLPALASLSLHVATRSTEKIVFGKEGFSVLRYLKFTCTNPWLQFEAGAMPKLETLNLCFSLPIRMIIIKRLSGLKEISAIVGSAVVDAGSAWRKAIINDPSNPKVQMMGSIYYGDQGRGMVTREGSEEVGNKEADIRVLMQPESSRKPFSAKLSREDEPDHRPFIPEIIGIPSESYTAQGSHRRSNQREQLTKNRDMSAALQAVFGTGDPISVPLKDDIVNTDPEKIVKNISWGMEEDRRLLERILDGVEDPRDLPFSLLKDITNGFSEERKIGQGGFGEVYKGVIGERIVAVKRIYINAHTFDDKLFHREVTSLMKSNHRNIVQFLGVCSGGYQKPIEKDGSGEYIWANVLERLLCFRYISNGSLDRHITDELRGLEWETRYEIITGICNGLRYLHMEKNIIHMDLKPANILLDHQNEKYMVPKITDFGLSRPNKNSHTLGQRYGTLEYMAPEYREECKTTQSCDIYSLGLIIIELVTGCKDAPNKDNVLRRWRHRWKKPPTQLQYQQVTRCIDIAGRCRKNNPEHRPTISWIINFLSESESTYWLISPSLDEDDMLRIDPLELRLRSELKNEISCLVELTNDTRNCIFAFNIQLPSRLYNAQPDKGIVRPESKYNVKITVHARDVGERNQVDKFIVQSMQVERKNCESSSGSGKADEASMECTNFNPAERPNMRHIINRLDKIKNVSGESENAAEAMMDHISEMLPGSDKFDGMAVVAPSDLRLLVLHQDIPNSPGDTSSKLVQKDLVFTVNNEQGYKLKQLRDLNNLHGSLEINGLENVTSMEEALEANLAAKERLTELKLTWFAGCTRCSPEVEADVLEGLCPPVGLKKLEISVYMGSRYPNWMVPKQNGCPTDLQELKLFTYGVGPAPQIVEAFPHLCVLNLGGNWAALPSNMEYLTSLKKLGIGCNGNIRALPTLPRSLEEFDLYGCNPKFMKSCKEVGHPNWQKIEHIPMKTFDGLSTLVRMQLMVRNFWRGMTM